MQKKEALHDNEEVAEKALHCKQKQQALHCNGEAAGGKL
jgi:hypothetical protein